jgi:hypothetical protein
MVGFVLLCIQGYYYHCHWLCMMEHNGIHSGSNSLVWRSQSVEGCLSEWSSARWRFSHSLSSKSPHGRAHRCGIGRQEHQLHFCHCNTCAVVCMVVLSINSKTLHLCDFILFVKGTYPAIKMSRNHLGFRVVTRLDGEWVNDDIIEEMCLHCFANDEIHLQSNYYGATENKTI